MNVMVGDLLGFEEVMCVLFVGDCEGFVEWIVGWLIDVCEYVVWLVSDGEF